MAADLQSSVYLARRRILSTIIHTLDDQNAYVADRAGPPPPTRPDEPRQNRLSRYASSDHVLQQQLPLAVPPGMQTSEPPPSIDRTIRGDGARGDTTARSANDGTTSSTATNLPPSANRTSAVASSASPSPVVKTLFRQDDPVAVAASGDEGSILRSSRESERSTKMNAVPVGGFVAEVTPAPERTEHRYPSSSSFPPPPSSFSVHTCSTAVQTSQVDNDRSVSEPDGVATLLHEVLERRVRRIRLHCFLRWHAKWFERQLSAARQRLARQLQTDATLAAAARPSAGRAEEVRSALRTAAERDNNARDLGRRATATFDPLLSRPSSSSANRKARIATQTTITTPLRHAVEGIAASSSADESSDEDDDDEHSLQGLLDRLSIGTRQRVKRAIRQCELPKVPRAVTRKLESERRPRASVSDDSIVMRLSRISANVDKSFSSHEAARPPTERRARRSVELRSLLDSNHHGNRRGGGENASDELTAAERKLRSLVKKLLWKDLPKWKRAERWEAYREASQTAIEALNALAHLSQMRATGNL